MFVSSLARTPPSPPPAKSRPLPSLLHVMNAFQTIRNIFYQPNHNNKQRNRTNKIYNIYIILEFIHPRCATENLCKERLYRHRCWSGKLLLVFHKFYFDNMFRPMGSSSGHTFLGKLLVCSYVVYYLEILTKLS